MAEEKSVGHSHASCEGCRKIKDSQCEETRKALEECKRAREKAEATQQEALEKELEEAKEKNKSLQKTVTAFQIATTVAVTLLGQEVFNGIMDKVNSVKEVQSSIVGESEKPQDDKNVGKGKTDGKKTVSFGGSNNIMTQSRFNEAMSQARYTPRVTITGNKDNPAVELTADFVIGKSSVLDGQGIGLQLLPPTSKQPQVATSTIDWSQYIVTNITPPIEAVVMSWGGDDWVDTTGAATSLLVSANPVPAPNGVSLLAFSLINSPRRRA